MRRDSETLRRRPNIVLMLSDDQGWGDLHFTGNVNLDTPNLDAMAADGVFFNRFYVQPLCAPTRAELLTGRWFPRTGVQGVSRRSECMNLDEVTLADELKAAGYATGCFGKWHSGSAFPYHPNGRGFDEFIGYCCGHWSHYFDSTLEYNGEEIRTNGYLPDVLTERAMSFMETNQDRPFLCYVPFNTPHSPFQVPDRWYDKFKERELDLRYASDRGHTGAENLDITRAVLAMCENIDWNVGRLRRKIEELGLTEDTIFVYLSDNGPNSWRWNAGMRGKKGSADEGGVRSPCVMVWKNRFQVGSRVNTIAGAVDLLPTLLELSEIPRSGEKPLDGMSLKPLLQEDNAKMRSPWPDRTLFALNPMNDAVSACTQKYRSGGETNGLFEIEQDMGQSRNLAEQLTEVQQELQVKIREWLGEVRQLNGGVRCIPVGFREFPSTYLNAQDAEPIGAITWSSIHPNASWLQGWNSVEDEIYWDIDVHIGGSYRCTLMYACPYGEEGSELELSCGENCIAFQIQEPFDLPAKDQDDRVPRVESYDKAFKSIDIGALTLPQGRGRIGLRASRLAGGMVCEVRALKVTLC